MEDTFIQSLSDSLQAATLAEFGLFNSAFHFAAIGMALVAPDGRWLRVNRSLCELVGYSEAELLVTSFQAITHPDDLDMDLNHVREMLAGEIDTYQMEKRYFHKNGTIVWILLSVSLVKDGDGAPLFFIAQIEDITARKNAEEALQKLNGELRAALAEVAQLRGILPMCAYCKKIRNDGNYWELVESYITRHTQARFSHGICPECVTHVRQHFIAPSEHVA
jgi:PAS domain S-box-containing protein